MKNFKSYFEGSDKTKSVGIWTLRVLSLYSIYFANVSIKTKTYIYKLIESSAGVQNMVLFFKICFYDDDIQNMFSHSLQPPYTYYLG